MQVATKQIQEDQYITYIKKVICQVMGRFGVSPEFFPEYLGAAYTGLIEAAARYDASSGVPFEKYAFHRVRGSILDYIRATNGESGKSTKAFKLLRASDCLTEDFSRVRAKLNTNDIDAALAEVLDYAAKGALIFRLSYFECEEEVTSELGEQDSPESIALDQEIANSLKEAVKSLPPREQEVIRLYYYHDYSFQMIADALHVTRSWISRMHQRAIRMLRVEMEEILVRE